MLAPLTGTYSELGNSLLYSLQLALEEINDENVIIVPRDSGFNEKEKLNKAINEIKSNDVKVVIGPITNEEFEIAEKHNDLIFISPSNINSEFSNNIISIGISLESQLLALLNFIKKQKKTKTVIMYPKNQFLDLIEKELKNLNLANIKTFIYSPNPEVLTGEIEELTNYTQRKRNLELRKKMFQDKEDEEKHGGNNDEWVEEMSDVYETEIAPAEIQEMFDHQDGLGKNKAMFILSDGTVSEEMGAGSIAKSAADADGVQALIYNGPISERIQEIASEASISTVIGTKPGKGFDSASSAKSWFSETHR